MYPEDDLKESSRYLAGFKWFDEVRPKNRYDIFRHAEAEMPTVVPEEKPQQEETTEPGVEEEQPKKHRARKGNSN